MFDKTHDSHIIKQQFIICKEIERKIFFFAFFYKSLAFLICFFNCNLDYDKFKKKTFYKLFVIISQNTHTLTSNYGLNIIQNKTFVVYMLK